MPKIQRSLFLAMSTGLVMRAAAAWGQSRRIRGRRWLTIAELAGPVELLPFRGQRRQAVVGDRLDRVGDMLVTGPEASARLEVDLAVGFIAMAENSQLQIRTLSTHASGGRITELFVLRGQVNLRIRQLTNPDSRIDIYTPAGVSGVRGTVFGVAVRLDGQTGVATQEGSVASSAQGQTVLVNTNQQSTIRPGHPPTPPIPLRDNPDLSIEVLRATDERNQQGLRLVEVVGYTDTVNLLTINDEEYLLDRAGRFETLIPSAADKRIQVSITTPLGTTQQYELVAP
ncbi:MAG: FecR domain-containing protein [Phormidesmis sp.]